MNVNSKGKSTGGLLIFLNKRLSLISKKICSCLFLRSFIHKLMKFLLKTRFLGTARCVSDFRLEKTRAQVAKSGSRKGTNFANLPPERDYHLNISFFLIISTLQSYNNSYANLNIK